MRTVIRRALMILLPAVLLLAAPSKANAQIMEIGTDALGWATLTPNIALDFGFAKHWSVGVSADYNPFKFKEGKTTQMWMVQPEVRWWPRHQFVGHAVGVHATVGGYNWGLWNFRYRGNMYGCGVTYSYAWMFHERWNLEGNIGVGYARLDHKNVYDRVDQYTCYGPKQRDFGGITKLGIKISYILF